MPADKSSHWASAHPDVAIEPDDAARVGYGQYSPLLYVMALSAERSIEGYLRCVECGYTAIAAHRLVRIRRDDYTAIRCDVLDTLFILDNLDETPADLTPSSEIRGDSFAIEFECEEAHRWFLEIGNHKGTVIAALSPGERGNSASAHQLDDSLA